MKRALVLGSSGLIGSHMVARLKADGYWVRGVDIRYPEFHTEQSDEFVLGDLRDDQFVSLVMFSPDQNALGVNGFDEVYQFAADMGGAEYIFTGDHDADVMQNSCRINLNVAKQAHLMAVKKLFYSSSACIYPKEVQAQEANPGLKESDAWPANPDSDYGVEKIFSERLYLAYAKNFGLNVRIARFHNIYGPNSPFKGKKAKAPAAICRKIITVPDYAKPGGRGIANIEIFGDGLQTRSFLHVDDCIDAVRLLMDSDFKEPINIGSEEMISINDLVMMVRKISGYCVHAKHIDGPVGVRGRNSNNDLIREKLGWEPKYTLKEGMTKLYNWIKSQYDGIPS